MNYSFKGVALFLGVHFGGTIKSDMVGFGSAIYIHKCHIMQVCGAWWLLNIL
jgi:hypothetical protein